VDEIIPELFECTGFEWDDANSKKIRDKHNVSWIECEQAFFNQPLVVKDDIKHSKAEKRYYSLAHTDIKRFLFIVFTIRKNKIRIISARDMNKKERREYLKHE